MGWLGWTPETAGATHVVLIQDAIESRSDLLAMIFGGKKGDKGRAGKVKAEQFKAFVAKNNARMKGPDTT